MVITTWYVEPLDVFTNRVIAENLPAENVHEAKLCFDKTRHNLWDCTYGFIAHLYRSRSDLRLQFDVWQKNGNGEIKPWLFGPKPKKAGPEVMIGQNHHD